MISHATEERLKTLLEKLAVIAEHRLDVIKVMNVLLVVFYFDYFILRFTSAMFENISDRRQPH